MAGDEDEYQQTQPLVKDNLHRTGGKIFKKFFFHVKLCQHTHFKILQYIGIFNGLEAY